MKKHTIIMSLIITVSILLLASCTEISDEEAINLIGEYKGTLEELYSQVNAKYKESPSVEGWKTFSSDWMPRLTGAQPQELYENDIKKYSKEIAAIEDAGSKLMYLWKEYDKAIAGEKLREEKVKELKEMIEEIFENINV